MHEPSQDNAAAFSCRYCGKKFRNANGHSQHLSRGCSSQVKRVSASLEKFQESNRPLKKRRLSPLREDGAGTAWAVPRNETSAPGMADITQSPDTRDARTAIPVPIPAAENTLERSGSNNRPVRTRRPNVRYKDYVDTTEERGLIEILDQPAPEPAVFSSELTVHSKHDLFGLRRCYYESPNHMPICRDLNQADDTKDLDRHGSEAALQKVSDSFGPCQSESEFLLSEWFNKHPRNTVTSFTELRALLDNPRFNPKDLPSANVMLSHLSTIGAMDTPPDSLNWLSGDSGWIRSSVTINVPFPLLPNKTDKPPPVATQRGLLPSSGLLDGSRPSPLKGGPQNFTVHDFYHRSLTQIIRDRLRDKSFQEMHIHPYDLRWKPGPDKEEVRVYSEMYSSQQFMKAHIDLQNAEPRPHRHPRVLLAMVFFSDWTKLASFGHAGLWGGYLQFGNDTKYTRAMPSAHKTEHFAYFQKLPSEIKAFLYKHNNGRKDVSRLLTHCRRELLHAQWNLILDEDFIDAYINGLLIECFDGVWRLFFPRIFVYIADYPEKVMLATIKYLTEYPCPHCMALKQDSSQLGTAEDMEKRAVVRVDSRKHQKRVHAARRLVYNNGRSVDSTLLQKYLDEGSYTITENAFSKKLSKFGFNIFSVFRTEFLHEWSSNGEGKKVHLHLLRILDTIPDKLSALDERYRQIPSFGKDSIRKFRSNISERSFQAARDVEDIVSCALPAYEGLLPEPHNEKILDLLFIMGEFQSLAKLRMHTDHTLKLLDTAVKDLGEALRYFVDVTCKGFKTMELKREAVKRRKNQKGKTASARGSSAVENGHSNDGSANDGSLDDRRETVVKLDSYKYHALGHIVKSIFDLGTTDSYTGEIGESEHRTGKRRYLRTDGRDYKKQLAQHERREARLRKIRERIDTDQASGLPTIPDHLIPDPKLQYHHQIGTSQNNSIRLLEFVTRHKADPIAKDFIPKLRSHLVSRIKCSLVQEYRAVLDSCSLEQTILLYQKAIENLEAPSDINDRLHVIFKSDTIYQHNILRVNYTAYDVRRQRDVLNPNTDHKDVMLLSSSDSPDAPRFRYGRILGVYHCLVRYNGAGSMDSSFQRFEFCWIRWFESVECAPRRFESLRFHPLDDCGSSGFINPDDIVRAAHVVPRFSEGFAHSDRKGLSRLCKDGSDYRQYYAASERDLYMRWHWGLGIGHKYSHHDAPSTAPSRFMNNVAGSLDSNTSPEDEDLEDKDDSNLDIEDEELMQASDSEEEVIESEEEEEGEEEDLDDEMFLARYG